MTDNISGIQYAILVGGNAAAKAKSTSYNSLIKKGYLENDLITGKLIYTEKAKKFINKKMTAKRNQLLSDYPEYSQNLIKSDSELIELYTYAILLDCEFDVYMYRGRVGLIDVDFQDEKYKALMDPYYMWEIEIEGTSGKFLKKQTVVGYKGSYMYKIDTNYISHASI